jgi:tetratricopeptide (TPR) repeat protein
MKKKNIAPKNKQVSINKEIKPNTQTKPLGLSTSPATWIGLFMVLIITLVSFYPATKNLWVNLDDDKYVTENPKISSLSTKSQKVLLFEPHDGNYHPLTMLSLAIDYQIGELSPKPYHISNIALHLANTLLIFWILWLLGSHFFRERKEIFAFLGALFFGVATQHVESVAWVSERKDVLYAMFYFASIVSYLYYLRKEKMMFLFFSLALFVLSILSKGMAVALSLSIVAIDYLYNRKLFSKKVILEKIPFFVLSFIFGLVAIWAQKSKGYMHQENLYDAGERSIYAAYALVNYIGKLLYPYNLSPIYPYPKDLGISIVPPHFLLYLIPAFLILFSIIYFRKRNRFIVFSFLFLLANLAFVLQFIPVGGVIMSDRYTYVASLGMIFLFSYGIVYLWNKRPKFGVAVASIAMIYMLYTAYLTTQQIKVWKDSFSLWDRVLGLYPHTPSAWYNLAVAYYDIQNYEKAIESYDKAIAISPFYTDAIYNRGNTKFYTGNYEGSIADFTLCVQQNPQHTKALFNRAVTYLTVKKFSEAESDCNTLVQLMPTYADAYFNRGIARINLQKNMEAISDFSQILQLNPAYHKAYLYRGIAKNRSGLKAEGCAEISKAMQLGVSEAKENFEKYCQNIN